MRKKILKAAALLALAAILSACTSIEDAVTAPAKTVNTPGITAKVKSKTEKTIKTGADGFAAEDMSEEAAFLTTAPITEDEPIRSTTTEKENGIVFVTDPPETAAITLPAESEAIPDEAEPIGGVVHIEDDDTPVSGSTDKYMRLGENGILVVKQNGHYWGLMGCYGTYDLCDKWAANANKFAKSLPNVNTYSMLIPTSSEFYVPEDVSGTGFSTTSQLKKIRYTEEKLVGITNVDAYSALYNHTDEPIFSRTDHHWMPLGAYYAAKAFSKDASFDFPDISEYKKVSRNDYVGSMYTYSKDVHLYNDPEEFAMYVSPNADSLKTTYYNTSFGGGYAGDLFTASKAEAFYCSFLGTDTCIAKIETGVKNGRKLVIFKESYGNALVPFLTSGFEEIYVCDIRYFTKNAVQFCKDVGATDLLFAVCTYTVAGTNGNYLGTIQAQ